MTGPASFRPRDKLAQAINDMEDDLHQVQRWGEILAMIATSTSLISPDHLYAPACAIRDLGRSLEGRFGAVHDLSMGKLGVEP